MRDFKPSADKVAFHGRHNEEETEVLRGSSGLSRLQIMESMLQGVNKVSAPKKAWISSFLVAHSASCQTPLDTTHPLADPRTSSQLLKQRRHRHRIVPQI